MQAIVVSYLPPTNTKGSRLKAEAAAGSITIPFPYEVGYSKASKVAANTLCDKLGWDSSMLVEGTLPNGRDVFVFVP